MYRLMPTKPSILLPSAGRLTDSAMAPSPAHLYFLVRPRSKAWLPMVMPSLPKKMPNSPSKLPGDLRQERRHVGGAERNAGGADHFAAQLLDLRRIGVARRLAPGIVGIGDVPLLAHLVDQIGRDRHRLRRRVVVGPEAVAVALGGGQRGVEAHADHVDDLVFLEHRHAGEADVGQEAADMHVDLVLDQQLLGLAAADVGLGLVVRHDRLERPAVDAARPC